MALLRAFGSYLPARVVKNAELATRLGVGEDWIESASGIRERRFADASESVVDLGTCAAKDCLSRGQSAGSKPGMLIVASGSAERQFPGPGVEIACRLGLQGAPVLDLPLPSTGALYAIALAERLAPVYGNILVVAAECMSRIVMREPLDRDTAILFGDGAGACLVCSDGAGARICDFILCTDGTYSKDLKLDFLKPLEMNGSTIILHAARKLPQVIKDLLARNSLDPADIETYLLHQANQNLLDRVAKALQVPAEKLFSNIRHYGNTSSASILIAASEWHSAGGLPPGASAVLAAFGAGFHWGALLIKGF